MDKWDFLRETIERKIDLYSNSKLRNETMDRVVKELEMVLVTMKVLEGKNK